MRLLAALLIAALIPALAHAREPEVVQLSPDTYMIMKEDHGGIFGSLAKMKIKIIKQASAFAAAQGKVAIPLATNERPMGNGPAQWASFEYQFRVVDKTDPEYQRTSLTPRPDVVLSVQGMLQPRAPAPAAARGDDDIYTRLIQLDDLRKRGLLTDEEFTAQKSKLLGG